MRDVIDSTEELATLGATLCAAPAFALDTEFLRERTYRAELCLVQVATRDCVTAIDPLASIELAPLAQALSAPVEKVLHSGRQDLEVLLPFARSVAPVFDTQVAAALAGHPAQIGYAELVRRLLGVELAKAHTRTDWSRRPLSPEQIAYAHDDVRHLLPLRDALAETIERLGRSLWLAEELRDLADPDEYVVRPENAWQRLKGFQGLDEGRLALLRALAAWREQRAVERNRPRGWILADASLRDIVLRVPRSIEALEQTPEIAPGFVKRSGEDILALVRASGIAEPPPPLPPRERPDPLMTALVKKLAALVQSIATELDVTPEILATRKDLEQIAAGRRDVHVLGGWRGSVIGERLLAAL